ncbi:collagen-like protein [Aquimarina sp. AU119]|uniref:collagen-like protein n=1 Tax=Aquimarina sp. AU119 TaxID=2108528 RepID=UPI000D68DECB|nr:collagen-like protein [Aquimarina sp. AU119]
MKAKKKLVRLLMVLMISASIFSCSDGEDGAIGPAGPAGVDGTDGVDGQDGVPGTANVIYSEWIDNGFELGDGLGVSSASFVIESPEITEKVLEQGVVLVFGRRLTTVAEEVEIDIYQLPYNFYNLNLQYRHRIEPQTGDKAIGGIVIEVVSTDGTTVSGAVTLIQQYRYVIIPGGAPVAPSSSGKSSSVDYSKMSYEEIKAQFNISE